MANHTSRHSRRQLEINELLGALPEDAAFLSTAGQAFVSIPIGDGAQTFPVSSPYLSDWLTGQYRRRQGQLPNEHSLREAIKSLRQQAHARPHRRPVDVRIVAHNETLFIDMANIQGDAIQITPGNWQITKPLGIAFRSARGQQELPRPSLPDSQTPRLPDAVEKWLVAALHPAGPYPILVLHGPPGSGKTTLARMLRALIDPVLAPIQPLPSRGKEVLDLAVRDRVLVFDHVTRMSNSAADALCQISSGTGVSIREPGDRSREPLRLDIARPIILTTPRTGLTDWQPREDLAERIIAVEMPKIENPRATESLWNEFETNRPAILAALYTAMSLSPAKNDERITTNDERNALYTASAQADPIFKAIQAVAAENSTWTGTATGLTLKIPNIPNARSLSHKLHQLQSALQTQGIELEFHRRHGGTRQITIRRNDERTTTNDERAVGADLRHPPQIRRNDEGTTTNDERGEAG